MYYVLILIGVVLGITVALRPRLFWPILIFATIVSSGLMVKGHKLVDEYLLFCVITGGLIARIARPARYQNGGPIKFYGAMFILFCFYMVFQSARGMILLEDLRMVRYIAFFTMLGVFSYVSAKGFFRLPSSEETEKVILKSALLYFVLYLAYGVFAESVRILGRFDVQGSEWTGSTVAMFPLFIALPPAISVFKKEKKHEKSWLARAVILAGIVAAFYYDSRIAHIFLIGVFFIHIRGMGFSKIIFVAAIWLISFMFLFGNSGNFLDGNMKSFITSLWESSQGIVGATRESDAGRKIEVLTAFSTVSDNWLRFLFGAGFYAHKTAMVPHYMEIAPLYGVMDKPDVIRTATFPAFTVDAGLLGIFLLCGNFLLCARQIITLTKGGRPGEKKIFLFPLLFVFLSMFISMNYSLVIFYLTIMPSGLLAQMIGFRADKQLDKAN